MEYSSLLKDVFKVADKAGERVLHIYQSDIKVNFKEDSSPITAADTGSHDVFVTGLRLISRDIPILSEEGQAVAWDERKHWRRFWLIDPIDGTKGFTQRTGEFTVNIALIENGEAVLGVVTAPALGEAFWGMKGQGADSRDRKGVVGRIGVSEPQEVKRVVASKNHLNQATRDYLDKLWKYELIQARGSLKFCRIAEGRADVYPRLGPTCEWDTAAAHAVLSAAGGKVTRLEGEPLLYGKEDLFNPHFIAVGAAP